MHRLSFLPFPLAPCRWRAIYALVFHFSIQVPTLGDVLYARSKAPVPAAPRMNADQSRIDELLARLSESLTVEVKRWVSTDEPQGLSKIVRGALALRNRNGGYFVIGFDDKTL